MLPRRSHIRLNWLLRSLAVAPIALLLFSSPAHAAEPQTSGQSILLHTSTAKAEQTLLQELFAGTEDWKPQSRLPSARWYKSVLRQEEMIAEQMEELRKRLKHEFMTTQDFLAQVSALFERTDRLYMQWKLIGRRAEPMPQPQVVPLTRKDVAIGKSLNYLRLSLINFFLGYADSNGKQIADAETQVALSKAWKTRSILFLKTLDSPPVS